MPSLIRLLRVLSASIVMVQEEEISRQRPVSLSWSPKPDVDTLLMSVDNVSAIEAKALTFSKKVAWFVLFNLT